MLRRKFYRNEDVRLFDAFVGETFKTSWEEEFKKKKKSY